ncbi:hypothetical protein [Desulfocurvibacter africanus]|nr:hypothetical protein [Desulfocurvibacter africanus]
MANRFDQWLQGRLIRRLNAERLIGHAVELVTRAASAGNDSLEHEIKSF